MIIWNVKNGEKEFDLDVDDCTILVDQSVVWYELVRIIDDYFNNRSSTVQLEEDTTAIQKKDWNCFLIPFDAQLQLDKITAKSPLNAIISECSDQLGSSPAFNEVKDSWEELHEEIYFINESLQKYELKASINDINELDLKSFISLSSTKPLLSPVEYKLLLLRLIDERSVDKKTLILIELPELFAGKDELSELDSMIRKMKARGFKFFLVTNSPVFYGSRNYIHYNKIINEASIEQIKRRIVFDAPFSVDDAQFEFAKQEVLRLVDNFTNKGENEEFSSRMKEVVRVLVYMILKNLNIDQDVDTQGFPSNIIEFINQY